MNVAHYEQALEGLRRLGGPDCREADMLEQARTEIGRPTDPVRDETAAYYIRECLDGVTKLFGIAPRQHDLRSPAKRLLASLELAGGHVADHEEVERSIEELRLALETSESERGSRVAQAMASQVGQELPHGREIDRFAGRWTRTVQRAAQVLHGDPHDEGEVSQLFSDAVDLISVLAGRMSASLDELDAFAALDEPRDQDADRVVALTADPRRAAYFYRRLESAAWLPLLRDRGVFEPPVYGLWPQGDYLARAASVAPESSLALAKGIVRDPHPLTVPFVLSVCAAVGSSGIRTAVDALTASSYPAPHAVSSKLREIASNASDVRLLGFIPKLADRAFEPISGKGSVVASKFDGYEYSSLVSTFVLKCPDVDLMELGRVLGFKLARALDLGREPLYRFVSLSRLAIGQSEDAGRREVADSLISGIRDALDRLRTIGTPLPDRIGLLQSDEEVTRRLRAHHLLEDLTEAQDVASEMVADEIARAAPTPETEALLRAVWARFEADQRLELLNRLGHSPAGGEEFARERARVWAWLETLEDIPEPWSSTRQELEAEFGERGGDSPFGAAGAYVGSRSPREAQDLVALGPAASLRFAERWRDAGSGWRDPSEEGLADALKTATASNPAAWVQALSDSVSSLRPQYVAAVLDGIAVAIREDPNRTFTQWEPVISVAEEVARQLGAVQSGEGEATWEWAAGSVVSLFAFGFDKDLVPARLHGAAADCLREYMRFGGPANVDSSDALTAAINKLSTRALEALLGIALTAHRLGVDAGRRVDELFDAIDEELSDASERRFATAICGRWLHALIFLDRASVESRLPMLFGDLMAAGVQLEALRDCLPWVQKNRETLVALVPFVRAYLDATDEDDGDREDLRAAVDWLVLCYDAELPRAWNPTDVLATLRWPGRLSRGAEMYGRILRESDALGQERTHRALIYWDAALARNDPAAAYEGFGWWAESDLSDEDWMSRLSVTVDRTRGELDWDQEVVSRLCRLPERVESWQTLAQMVKGAKEYWSLVGWREGIREMLQATEPPWQAHDIGRRELIEALLEREMFEFREFLDVSD